MQGKGTFNIQHATLNIQRPGLIGGAQRRRRYDGAGRELRTGRFGEPADEDVRATKCRSRGVGFPACGFTGLSCPVSQGPGGPRNHQSGTGD